MAQPQPFVFNSGLLRQVADGNKRTEDLQRIVTLQKEAIEILKPVVV